MRLYSSFHLGMHNTVKTTQDQCVRLVEASGPKDPRQREQLHYPDGGEIKGGIKDAMC